MELLSEEEQWERLKHWLRTNGPFILAMVVVAFVGWFGIKWWQERGEREANAASATYEKILEALDETQYTDALALIEALRTEYPKSPYVAGADMVAARVFVERNELDKAVERLERVMNTAVDEKLRPLARIRLARLLSSQGQYDKALETLGTASLGVHEAARLEARGDVYFAQGDSAAALKEYEAARLALVADQGDGVGELLDLKIADVKASALPASAEPPAAETP